MNTARRASARRLSNDSNPGSVQRQTSQTRIPMGPSRSAANRNTQPSYDFLAGPGDASPPRHGARSASVSKPSLRAGSRPPSRSESRVQGVPGKGEDLRAQVRTLEYELKSLKQERDMTRLRHEKEQRDAAAKHETELKNAKVADRSNYVAISKYEAITKELEAARGTAFSKTGDVEKRLRSLQEENRTLKEELEEVQTELASKSRGSQRQLGEVETKHAKLQQTLNDLRTELQNKDSALNTSQQKLSEKDAELGAMEAENVRLRAQGGDVEELAIVKREVSEQVAHIRKLESANREQTTELRRLRDQAKTVAIIQEEKHVLEIQVERMERLERELGEAKFQRQLLEDEKSSWMSYLQNAATDEEVEFDSPEAMARALTSERIERASLLDKFGQLQPEVAAKESKIASLQVEIQQLKDRPAAVDTPVEPTNEAKARARLERQQNLAKKEIEYLKAQLKTFETEDTTNMDIEIASNTDEATKARIATLEDLVNQYRSELDAANKALSSSTPVVSEKSLKRPSPTPEDTERVSVLTRKVQTLQQALSKAETKSRTLSSDLSATKTQLSHLQSSSRTRILSLRENPTDTFSRETASTIAILRQENADLHSQLSSSGSVSTRSDGKVVPVSYLASARSEISTLRTQLASSEKRLERLRQIWSAKSLEFRAAVASLLGWRIDFLASGKFRLTSLFHPCLADEGKDEDERIWDTSFIFDGEKGSMKINGGAESVFGQEVKGLVEYWVQERKEIPGFLAACTMEWVEGISRTS